MTDDRPTDDSTDESDRPPDPSARPWRGRWLNRPPTDPDVVLAVAGRRGVDPGKVETELDRVADRFDVERVYLSDEE